MGKLTGVINKARKALREKQRLNANHLNQLLIVSEYTKKLEGQLVVVLAPSLTD